MDLPPWGQRKARMLEVVGVTRDRCITMAAESRVLQDQFLEGEMRLPFTVPMTGVPSHVELLAEQSNAQSPEYAASSSARELVLLTDLSKHARLSRQLSSVHARGSKLY